MYDTCVGNGVGLVEGVADGKPDGDTVGLPLGTDAGRGGAAFGDELGLVLGDTDGLEVTFAKWKLSMPKDSVTSFKLEPNLIVSGDDTEPPGRFMVTENVCSLYQPLPLSPNAFIP